MKVYVIFFMLDQDIPTVDSVWSTHELASAELIRLQALPTYQGLNLDICAPEIIELQLDKCAQMDEGPAILPSNQIITKGLSPE